MGSLAGRSGDSGAGPLGHVKLATRRLVVVVGDQGNPVAVTQTADFSGLGSYRSTNRSLHSMLHPRCSGDCVLNDDIVEALARIEQEELIEWEHYDTKTQRVYRMQLSKFPGLLEKPWERRDPYAILTIADITHFRRQRRSLEKQVKEMTVEASSAPVDLAVRLRAYREENLLLKQQLTFAAVDEREKVARDLHDGVAQHLAILKYNIEGVIHRSVGKPLAESQSELERIVEDAQHLAEDVRRLSRDMSPLGLSEGVQNAVQAFCEDIDHSRQNIRVEHDLRFRDPLPFGLERSILFIVKEAIGNAVRHADPSFVEVSLSQRSQVLTLRILDDGHGFAPKLGGGHGVGLANMRKRALESWGSLEIDTKPGQGTQVVVSWDLTRH